MINAHGPKYTSVSYGHVKYKIGDSIVISAEKGGWGVAQINDIYQSAEFYGPQFKVQWFWRGTEVRITFYLRLNFDGVFQFRIYNQ